MKHSTVAAATAASGPVTRSMFGWAAAAACSVLMGCGGGGGSADPVPDDAATPPPVVAEAPQRASSPDATSASHYYWATTAPLDNHTIRFDATLASPAACELRTVTNDASDRPGYSQVDVVKLDGDWAFMSASRGGATVRFVSDDPAIDETVFEAGSLPNSSTLRIRTFDASERVSVQLITGHLSANNEEFAPGYSYAFSLECSAPFSVSVMQGDDTALIDTLDLEGSGLYSPVFAVTENAGFAEVSGSTAGYLSASSAEQEAGTFNISHPTGFESYNLALSPSLIDVTSAPGTYDFAFDRAAVDPISSGRWLAIYSFDDSVDLRPGRLDEDVTR